MLDCCYTLIIKTISNGDEILSDNHAELKTAILGFLKSNKEAATMNFQSFYEAVAEVFPAKRAETAVTLTLMELNGEVVITKDTEGRGLGFALPGN